jgi:transposase
MVKNRKNGVSMFKAREVLRQSMQSNQNNSDIAFSCKIDRTTVIKYLKIVSDMKLTYQQIENMTDSELEKILKNKKGRKQNEKRVQPDFQYIHSELKKKSVTLQCLWEEYIEENPDGYKRAHYCHLYREWKKPQNLSMRQTHKAGEKMFVDYSGHTMEIKNPQTGKMQKAEIFVAVLGASDYAYAEASLSQSLPDWINSHVNAFKFFGGVTEIIVPDNLKSGVTKANRYDPELNREYHEMSMHYNTAIVPARVRAPKDKSKAENGVFFVQRKILAKLRNMVFFSLEELNKAISEQLEDLNNQPFNKLSGCRSSLFKTTEKPYLKPLPEQPYIFANWKTSRVNRDYHIELNEHYYSVPYKFVDQKVEIRYTRNTVEIFNNNKRIASHPRNDISRGSTTIKEHMPKSHQEYLQWSPSKILSRAKEIGESVLKVVNKINEDKQHLSQAHRVTLGIIRLEKEFGEQRLEAACHRAINIGGYSYKSIQSILNKGLDRIKETEPAQTLLIEHENLRNRDDFFNNTNMKQGEYSC